MMIFTSRFILLITLLAAFTVQAQTTVIRNATVHTALKRAALQNTDILIENGRIEDIGEGLEIPEGTQVVEANGLPVTPGLFGGVSALGLEEVSLESDTVDNAITFNGEMRPEFDVTLAYNPLSVTVDANRAEGITWTLLGSASREGGNIIAGQGAGVTLSGSFNPILEGSRSLFVNIGAGNSGLSGSSRAGHYMLLNQALREAQSTPRNLQDDQRLLTATGRDIISRYLEDGRWIFAVDRAADIIQVLQLARRDKLSIVILGGAEAWRVADRLEAANVPVILDALNNLPNDFDQIGARLNNAALLARAGVRIAFTNSGSSTHNARKVRQIAGNAVANGLSWYTALRAITRNPALILGLGDDRGGIRKGMYADLVLWSGDPLEVTSYAEQVWINGRRVNMETRQDKLLKRYLSPNPDKPRHYIKP